MPKVGAHVSAAVSLELAFEKAEKIGAECFQFFVSPPQQWVRTEHSDEEIERFKNKALETQIGPNFIHATYLVNLGASNPEHLQKSIDWLIYALDLASKLGVQGVIVHTGSHKGVGFEKVLEQVAQSIQKILKQVQDDKIQLILETSAGGGGSIGRTFWELGEILKQASPHASQGVAARVQVDRLKVCIDTQHTFASGYDYRTPLVLKDVLEEFDQEIGLSNLAVIHANDSKVELHTSRDRHENIGEGFIGRDGFSNLVNHPKLKDMPFILEVPGFAGNGPDKENVDLLKSLKN